MPSNTGNETSNIENELQLTLHNAAYKITVSRVEEWYNLLNIRYYKHLYETYHIHWVSTRDKSKSNDTILEMKIKTAELPPNKQEIQTKEQKDAINFNDTIPPRSQIMYVIYICYTIPQICSLYKETTETHGSIMNTSF